MRTALLVVLAGLVVACSPPNMTDAGTDGGDGGDGSGGGLCAPTSRPDGGGVRHDLINVNCTSLAGNENVVDCNARLGMQEMGASFFIGGRDDCDPDRGLLYSPNCRPLCDLSCINPTETNGMMCSFTTMQPGCPYSAAEGYVVVVEAGGRRQAVGVDSDGNCARPGTGISRWARVSYESLRDAVQCARTMPEGGFGPVRFISCPTGSEPCGNAMDSCMQLSFMTPSGMMYMQGVCTRMCGSDMDCGPRGSCSNGVCFAKCGGPCNLSCPSANQSCNVPMGATSGICLPGPP